MFLFTKSCFHIVLCAYTLFRVTDGNLCSCLLPNVSRGLKSYENYRFKFQIQTFLLT